MSIESDRLITSQGKPQEELIDRAIRPTRLADYVGQPIVREQMEIFIGAANAPLVDHPVHCRDAAVLTSEAPTSRTSRTASGAGLAFTHDAFGTTSTPLGDHLGAQRGRPGKTYAT